MSFFDNPPEHEDVRPGPADRLYAPNGPLWLAGPDQYYLPALLAWSRELGRSERVMVALSGIRVWPDSCTLDLVVASNRSLMRRGGGSRLPMMEPPSPGGFRFGVLFGDGRRATNLDRGLRAPLPPNAKPGADPVLRIGGGGGGQFHYRVSTLLWPLPPDGPLTLVVEWPDENLTETRTELDGSALRAAATEAVEIWPGLPPAPAGEQPLGFGYGHSHASFSSHAGGSATVRRVSEPPEAP